MDSAGVGENPSASPSSAGRALAKSSRVHSGFSSSGRDARSALFFFIRLYLSFVCLAETDDMHGAVPVCEHRHVQTVGEMGQRPTSRLSVVPPNIPPGYRRFPFEFGN